MTLLSLLPFPPLFWWQQALAGNDAGAGENPVYLDKTEPFRKMGLRNRYRIAASNGPLWLTIPILGGREQRLPVADILIDNRSPWQRTHWRSIGSVYRRTAFFEHYEDSLRPLFEQSFERLVNFNLATIAWSEKALGMPISKIDSLPPIESGQAAETPFKDLRERFTDYKAGQEKPYVQPFMERTGFLPGMSILDGLFCEGPVLAGRLR